VVFDIYNDFKGKGKGLILSKTSKEYVYRMIETLLPKAQLSPKGKFSMLELWGDTSPRKGWIKIVQK